MRYLKPPFPAVKWAGVFAFQAGILDPVKQQTHYSWCGSNLAEANLSETLYLSLFIAVVCRTLCQATSHGVGGHLFPRPVPGTARLLP